MCKSTCLRRRLRLNFAGHGRFATRSPYRPNLIALSEVDMIAVRDNFIEIDAIDAFADTPVLDLKP